MKPTVENLAQRFGHDSLGAFAATALLPPQRAGMPILAPASLDAACEILRCAAAEGWRVLPAGAGEHFGPKAWDGMDLVLTTQRLHRVLEYEPAEMVLVAEAGLTLHDLAALAAQHDQRLASDVWPGCRATVGGAVAAHRPGRNRRAAGTLREALLGARVVHADGRTSKTGGRVVKNVAGFDLGKLYLGSYGSLALLAEVNLRLVPRAETMAVVIAPAKRARSQEALLAVHRAPDLSPAAVLLISGAIPAAPEFTAPEGQVTIVARFEGRDAVVRAQVDLACRLLGAEAVPAERAAAAYDALRASAEPRAGAILLRISSLPVAGIAILEALDGLECRHPSSHVVVEFGVGTSFVQLADGDRRELRALGARLAAAGARLDVLHAPAQFDFDPEPPLDPTVADLVRLTKQAFDPEQRFADAPAIRGGS